jgi:hypothetical protein
MILIGHSRATGASIGSHTGRADPSYMNVIGLGPGM